MLTDMKYYPKYRVVQTFLFTLLFALVPTALMFAFIRPFYTGFSFIFTFQVLFILLLVLTCYVNFQIFYISIDNSIITVRYFFHRPESTFKIDLREIEKIRLTTTLKNARFFELKTKKGMGIDIDLNAIPLTTLTEIADKYKIEIVNENTVD